MATKCSSIYEGPSYPEFHGEKCILDLNHIGAHFAVVDDRASKGRLLPLSWYTADQHEEVRQRLKGGLGNE
jgi:hypothetical protein